MDPHLSHRVRHLRLLLAGERRIYEGYLALIDGLFEDVRSAVLRPFGIIDPFGVFSELGRWVDRLAAFTADSIGWVLARAYEEIAGEAYPFTSRPFVSEYLAQVANKMVNTPEQVFDLIRADIEDGARAGDGIPEIAARIQRTMTATGTPHWANRATLVARTETGAAFNAGSLDAMDLMAEHFGLVMEKVWLATADASTRDTHRAADGQRVPLEGLFIVGEFYGQHPGAKTLPVQEVANCRCTFIAVEQGEAVDWSNRGWPVI